METDFVGEVAVACVGFAVVIAGSVDTGGVAVEDRKRKVRYMLLESFGRRQLGDCF
jgi:hypothetical protein